MIRKIKDVYNNYDYVGCDQFVNCTGCVESDNCGCIWFENKYEHVNDDKEPIITYEYKDDQKN